MVEDLTVQSLFPQFAIKALAVAILTMAVGILYAFFVPTQASLFLSTLALISGSYYVVALNAFRHTTLHHDIREEIDHIVRTDASGGVNRQSVLGVFSWCIRRSASGS